jgi:hypothetical protein
MLRACSSSDGIKVKRVIIITLTITALFSLLGCAALHDKHVQRECIDLVCEIIGKSL